MNYRHGYHAGGFSDVFKHVILLALIQALSRKEKPFCYLETHAGRGQYDLSSVFSQKTKEYSQGIDRIMAALLQHSNLSETTPKLIKKYADIVSSIQYPLYYPGSPLIARESIRKDDRMVLMELHPEEFNALKALFKNDKQIECHLQDGMLGLKAFLPPQERRALVLIDPPFEKPTEWKDLIKTIQTGLQKFPSGVFAIWYPLKNPREVKKFLEDLRKLKSSESELFISEITVYPQDTAFSLIGCGMAILNPPWQIDIELKATIPWLWKALSVNRAGSYRCI